MRRSHNRTRIVSRTRTLALHVDGLEQRQLLSTMSEVGPAAMIPATVEIMSPMGRAITPSVSNPTPYSSSYTPAQMQAVYGFSKISFGTVKGDGTGQTIAIVDAYDDPSLAADLTTFDTQFGLPAANFTRVSQSGSTTSLPSNDSTGGWEGEEALDVEWAHAIAPGASILLVEASDASDTNLLAAVNYASSHASVVSMSWGGGEFNGETSYDSDFSHAGVAYVASSGDQGAPIEWPAASANVIAVGGTSLSIGSGNTYGGESAWSGSGGGPSAYVVQPTYQKGVVTQQTTMRANPDVAYDADPNTGVAVYNSFSNAGWQQYGGTSAGSPQWAALIAIADQGRALSSQPALNATSPQEILTDLYKGAGTSEFHDVTTGTTTGATTYSASAGYDYTTGLGSPVADQVVGSLVGTVVAPTNDHLALGGSSSDVAGATYTVTVTAQTSTNATDAAYRGTVHFTSSDAQAGLPANYTFTAADAGSHTFTVTLKTAGTQSVSAVDTANASVSGNLSGVAVSPAAASQFLLSGLSASQTAGTSGTITVTAKDPFGNLATGFTGTVTLTSTDTAATLPGAYTFTTADHGAHTFTLTFNTAGTESVTASTSGITATQSGITVAPAAPISLKATASSTSQINLTWTSGTGDTGYTIQRSANGSTGWTQIGTTTGTTYSDTGLTAGTTYYYRVVATGGSVSSAYSNTANAATVSNPIQPGTTDTIWSNSYVPNENYYASGTYDVGVKFQSSVAGTVTGARFYKQTWMSGYTHVGYLWSSSGTLLASATFTGETSYGWQQVTFSNPVSIAANTTYIVSFSTGGGYFGITSNFFNSNVTSGPLTALSNSVAGGDGVYGNGNSSFPTTNGGGMNFWADVAFTPTASPSAVTPTTKSAPTPVAAVAPTSSTTGNVAPSAASTTGNAAPVTVTIPVRKSARPVVTQVTYRNGVASPFGA